MIEQPLQMAALFGWGMLLGMVYYGGLWLSVQRLPQLRRPALWWLASFIVRTVLAVLGFYLASGGQWQCLLVSLAGFLVTRALLVRRIGKAAGLSVRGA